MEFDEIVVKESPGLCRCCLSEGCYKDMGTEYTWMNENEVYADMLLECFDISVSQHNEGPNGPNRLICEVCITRLRDACNFKKQVLDSEKKFVDMIGRGEFGPKVLIYPSQMKSEAEDATVNEVEYLDDGDMDFGDDEPLKPSEEPSISDITVSSLPIKNKRGRPKKAVVKTEKKAKVAKLEEKAKSSKSLVKGMKERRLNKDQGEETALKPVTNKGKLTIMRSNVVNLVSNTTAMPFRWLKSSYRCFYCYEVFQEPKDLKSHNELHKENEEIEKIMNNYWETTVFVDVSNMKCKLCSEIPTDFYRMIDHLMAVHQVAFNKDIGMCMSPFKLHNISVECVVCEKHYRTFGFLLVHSNKEHKGCSQLLCEICGQHFRHPSNLKAHVNKEHIKQTVECNLCGEHLTSVTRMRTHMQHFHNKRYKCFKCAELFETHYKRSLHMMTVHKSRDEVKCQHCGKTFVFRSTMMRHVRETHLQEKNAVCGICGWKAFGINRLQRHMMKHSNERNFKCPACEKAFKTKKTMTQHYNNIHQKILGPH